MKRSNIFFIENHLLILLVLIISFTSPFLGIIKAQTNIVRAFPNLSFSSPVDIQFPKDNTNRLFVVSQEGVIHVLENNSDINTSSTFLDIRDSLLFGGEQGLVGLAFHPNFVSNGYFFLNYTRTNPRRTIISRFSVSADHNLADPNSEVILLEVDQPYSNHNGGQISFGPDGYLYTSLGDGGSGGDPENRAQNLSSLLGKILRIDVDNQDADKKYSIPNDNPFKGNNLNFAEEIYAYGLRNVWRFSFDDIGRLWAADVGQGSWEEISIIENGGNYGWKIMEGFHCYIPSTNCSQEGLELPVWEYGHNSNGGYSITGGYIYSGASAPELLNKYVYGDFVSGNIWALDPNDSTNTFIRNFNARISTFGVDQNSDLYLADYNSGSIFKFIDDNVNSVSSSTPNLFKLDQNYPNPFNPSTIISYSIPGNIGNDGLHYIKLKIFDILGKEITTLVNQEQKSGNYQVEFNAEKLNQKLSSGVYFYKLSINNLTETKKMLLLN